MAPGKIGPGANPRGWRWHVLEIEPATRGQDIVVRRGKSKTTDQAEEVSC